MPPGDALEGRRLDSWKEIADYLGRGVATVRRWEQTLGLPVRRLPGASRSSVFAFTADIDAWLRSSGPATESGDGGVPAVATISARLPAAPTVAVRWRGLAVLAVTAGACAAGVVFLRPVAPGDLRVATTTEGIVVTDSSGTEQWRYGFAPDYDYSLPSIDMEEPSLVVGGPDPAVFAATHVRERRADRHLEGGALMWFTPSGGLLRSFSFDDRVSLNGVPYAPPWAITSFSVHGVGGGRQTAVAAHHHLWNASLVTVLDDQWRRRGTFVHNGWVESLRWLAPDRLVIAGFSNTHNGGMVALLDPSSPETLEGQGPEREGTPGYCDRCGAARPIRMVILPRSPLNRATASPFNRATAQVTPNGIVVRTYEVPPERQGPWVEGIYAFSASLELADASFNDRYLDVKQALIEQGRLREPSGQGGARPRPSAIEVWQPGAGWTHQVVPE